MNDISKILEMNKTLNTFRYGILSREDKTFIEHPSSGDFSNFYRYMSPKEFYRTRGGVCWDYAEYQYRYLKSLGFNVMNYYIELGYKPNYPTHTITIIKDSTRYIYTESSFKRISGVYTSTDIDAIFQYVVQEMVKDHQGKVLDYFICPYPGYNNYGCDCATFMNHMRNLKPIRNNKARYDRGKLEDALDKIKIITIGEKLGGSMINESYKDLSTTYQESVFLSKDNLELNLSKWKPGVILWITGSSGDGKSTLARKLGEDKNAVIISTDYVLIRMTKTKEKFERLLVEKISSLGNDVGVEISKDFVSQHPEIPYGLGHNTPENEHIQEKIFNMFFVYLMERAKEDLRLAGRYVIVEGCDISYMELDLLMEQPLIIMGCSRLRGFIQRYKREQAEEKRPALKVIMKLIRKYRDYGKELDDKKWKLWKDVKSQMKRSGLSYESTDDFYTEASKSVFIKSGEIPSNVMVPTDKELNQYKSDIKKAWSILKEYYNKIKNTPITYEFSSSGHDENETHKISEFESISNDISVAYYMANKTFSRKKDYFVEISMTPVAISSNKLRDAEPSALDDITECFEDEIIEKTKYALRELDVTAEVGGDTDVVTLTITMRKKLGIKTEESVNDGSSQRKKVLDLTIKEIKSNGKEPKINSSDKDGWVSNNNSGDFKESLCIAGLGNDDVKTICSKVNKVIQPEGGRLTPDNYGTAFLRVKESTNNISNHAYVLEETENGIVCESYATNYIKNKIMLHKFGKHPEMDAKKMKDMLRYITKTYAQYLSSKEVKELKKNKKKVRESFYPIGSLEFKNKQTIMFALNFDDSEFTPGAAIEFEDDNGMPVSLVVIYPAFFKDSEDIQIFTLLHEIGHIRLGHTKWYNSPRDFLTGAPNTEDYRGKMMHKMKVMYPELNADLYAVLSGASMYTILKLATDMDYDKKYDYRFTNAEMANRYLHTMDKYIKMRGEDIHEAVEGYMDDWDDDLISCLFNEAASDSHIIIEKIYPRVEAVLKTPAGDKTYRYHIEAFIDRNSEKLHEPCPISMIPFTDTDKATFYNIFQFDEKELKKIISEAVSHVSDTANFLLVKQNPLFSVFYCCMRYYTLTNNKVGINATLIIHALASYPSIFSKYFKYGANPGVMKYTADNLTEKFIFKQEGHVFGALLSSINSSYTFLKPFFKDGSDKEVVRYIQRIRNDQNSMIKKIYNEYDKNYKAGRSITTQNETYDTGAIIDDATNDTSKVEAVVQKVLINILTNELNLRLVETAAKWGEVSVVELRYYLTQIMVNARTAEIEQFITSILFIYLYTERHTLAEIRSNTFLSFGIDLFRRTKSNDKNVQTIKNFLNTWSEETGVHKKYKREATRNSYKKGIYWYIMLNIQLLS